MPSGNSISRFLDVRRYLSSVTCRIFWLFWGHLGSWYPQTSRLLTWHRILRGFTQYFNPFVWTLIWCTCSRRTPQSSIQQYIGWSLVSTLLFQYKIRLIFYSICTLSAQPAYFVIYYLSCIQIQALLLAVIVQFWMWVRNQLLLPLACAQLQSFGLYHLSMLPAGMFQSNGTCQQPVSWICSKSNAVTLLHLCVCVCANLFFFPRWLECLRVEVDPNSRLQT